MALRHLDSAPRTEDFTPLQEHQEQTPSTFFDSKPVLHTRYTNVTLAIPINGPHSDPAFAKFSTTPDEEGVYSLAKDVDIWVSSSDLVLFQNAPNPTGVAIPYPLIALHATMKFKSQVDALYMNISLNDAETVNDEEDIQILELTVLPPNYASNPDTACIKEIFAAMNTCADLHPDPDDSDVEAEVDETAPGATGWITAENMDQYLDEEGNFRGPVFGDAEEGEPLGPGAGTVRSREDDEEEKPNGVHGADDETKWQRTG